MSSAAADGGQKNKLFIKGKCFSDCEAKVTVGEEKTEFYVCMEQLARLSEYFRTMFFGDFKYNKQFEINDESTEDMICFFNSIDPHPNVQKIADDSVELLIRLSDKYHCDDLKDRLKIYIESHRNDSTTSASTILDWLVWSVKYNMHEEFVRMCLPGTACVPLSTLWDNQEKIGLELCNKLIEAKFKVFLMAGNFHYQEKGTATSYSCKKCEVKGGLLPYAFCSNRHQHTGGFHSGHATFCSSCVPICCSTEPCNIGCNYYYKCPKCYRDPARYENTFQCFCARKNYEILFSETS